MAHAYAEIAFTPRVRAEQERLGSRGAYARLDAVPERNARLGEAETTFIAARDSLYMASVSETGWPYVQHRGGPAGFVRVLDERTLAFADFRGNRQYVSLGNLGHDPRVSLFFMDYANRRRLKLFGRARASADADLLARLAPEGTRAAVERAIVIEVAAFDWNCPQHITERHTVAEIRAATAALTARIAELEAALADLGVTPPPARPLAPS